MKGVQNLVSLLALLRAQNWVIQTLHWQFKQFEGHLLFERIYDPILEQIDDLAEKIVGIYDAHLVNEVNQMELAFDWVKKWSDIEDEHRKALAIEEDFQRVCRETYDSLKEEGILTLGQDDFLMSIAHDHERNVYLLKQILKNKVVK